MRVILTVIAFIFFLGGINAQNAPDELIGKWKIVSIYAVDSLGVIDAEGTAVLTEGLVNNWVVEYQFDTSTFSLFINGELIGSRGFNLVGQQFQFDGNGDVVGEYVNSLYGILLESNRLEVKVDSPDSQSGIVWYQTLLRNP
ncbi:MAG: hypothetical protein R2730_01525 [Chitinophagales bacterium]